MTQEEIETLNSSILLKDLGFITKNLSTKKTFEALMVSLVNSTKYVRKKNCINLTQSFKN